MPDNSRAIPAYLMGISVTYVDLSQKSIRIIVPARNREEAIRFTRALIKRQCRITQIEDYCITPLSQTTLDKMPDGLHDIGL